MKTKKIIHAFTIVIVLLLLALLIIVVLGGRKDAETVYDIKLRTETIEKWVSQKHNQKIIYNHKTYDCIWLDKWLDSLTKEGDKKIIILNSAEVSTSRKREMVTSLQADLHNMNIQKLAFIDSISKAIDNPDIGLQPTGDSTELRQILALISSYKKKAEAISSGPLFPELKSVTPLKKDKTLASYASETKYFKITYYVKGCVVPKNSRTVYFSVFDSVKPKEWQRVALKSTKSDVIAFPDATGLPVLVDKSGNNEIIVEAFSRLKKRYYQSALSENPNEQYSDFSKTKKLVPVNFKNSTE